MDVGNNGKKKADDKKRVGRPKVLPPEMSERFQIRCSADDIEAWEKRAADLGYVGASAWIRKVLNDAIKKPATAR